MFMFYVRLFQKFQGTTGIKGSEVFVLEVMANGKTCHTQPQCICYVKDLVFFFPFVTWLKPQCDNS